MSQAEQPEPPKKTGVSVNEIQNWAQRNTGRIWMVVVLILATVSSLIFFPNLTLILMGVGLVLGSLLPKSVLGATEKAVIAISSYSGSTRLIALIGVGVVAVVMPFLLSLLIGAEGAAALLEHHHFARIIRGSKQ